MRERRGKESVLNPDWQTLILDVALRSGFVLLGEDWGKEIIELSEHTSRLTTETRIVARGGDARRRFGLYWSFIYPGSALIRYGWLEAIRRRAERLSSTPP